MKVRTIDWLLYLCSFLLTLFGIVVIYSITYGQEVTKNFAFYQLVFAGVGFVLLIGFSLLDYHLFRILAYPLYGLCLFLLLLVLFTPLGKATYGATRWINLGFFQFQPSELLKLIIIVALARVSSQEELGLKQLLFSLALVLVPIVLVFQQPDLGTALIIFIIGMGMIALANYPKKYLFALLVIVLLFFGLGSLSLFSVGPFKNILKPYQKERLLVFLEPQKDPFGAGYNVSQAMIAIGSGGFLGRGLGHGPQSQLNFIPSKHTDFIFAVASEAFGFVGVSLLLAIFFVLCWRILKIAQKARDDFGTLLGLGVFLYFFASFVINVGMNMGVLPATGVPLPFISYGGTSLMTNLIAIGLCQSVMIRHKKIRF